ncbi:hypothetical protein GH714_034705 [Hevea brasiliensis]|uniref:EF-hand domain-containing protein n=1 Tax=Hevea brasiliensis TaxID=3981 RepID=A0A6A6KKK4_HEVBR|nr:hypothetical protein GH714_034705 [Hevea brasiliensis]
MKQFIKAISPKRLFRSKKDRSIVSRSDPSSYSYGATSSSSSDSSVSNHKRDSRGELVQAFKLIDRDNDGIISRNELEALLLRLGTKPPSQEEVATMLREVDHDGDGYISVEALMSRIGSPYDPAVDDELKVAFEFFDTDQDGKITAEELHEVYKALGDERCTLDDCRRMIEEVDKNGDGFVCFEDFSRMMELQR